MKKTPPTCVWGNGIGFAMKLWFKKPRLFVLKKYDDGFLYVPEGERHNYFWVEPKMGIQVDDCCVTCISQNSADVARFTRAVQSVLEAGDFWQDGLLRGVKKLLRKKP